MHEDLDKIRITTDDLEQLSAASTLSAPSEGTAEISPGSGEVRRYGNIRDTVTTELAGDEGKAKIFLRAWFYLGAAGLLGALAGWGLNEPFFIDGPDSSWADMFMIPSVVAAVCLGCAVAESVVEHSARKALVRGVIALGLGVPLGFVFDFVASFFYNILLALAAGAGTLTPESPAWWACRSLAWALFGASAGLVYGVVGRSGKKLLYGLLGGMLGAGIGGALFDPIALMVDSGGLSRAAGFGLFGLATGVAIGLVESALKDRWLYVSAGPLAGKQFILYKTVTTLGRNQGCDIYLFKDPSIGEMHATFEMRGSHVWLMANGPVYISGQPVKRALLKNRDLVRIGRYSFLYQERQRL
ncbi:MAG: FHA domain-containing protein [Bryobacterales bacterium]|nr:FHA domain-containing protein [Bryobacterales bacterium]